LEFKREEPPINIGADISVRSFEMIEEEIQAFDKAKDFDEHQLAIISRLIHTSTCFEQVLDNIYFSDNSIEKIKNLLLKKAKIIVDVNMIKVGLSDFYLNTYENEVVCYIKEAFTYEAAEKKFVISKKLLPMKQPRKTKPQDHMQQLLKPLKNIKMNQ